MDEIFFKNGMLYLVLVILVVIVTLFQFSFESAFNTLKRRKEEKGEEKIKLFGKIPEKCFSPTINFVHYFLLVVIIFLLYPLYNSWGDKSTTTFVSLAILFILFVEVIPLYVSKYYPETMYKISFPITRLAYIVGYPVIKIISKHEKFSKQYSQISEYETEIIHERNDLNDLYGEIGEQEFLSDEDESNILNRIFKLGDVRVYEVMRPRTEIVGIEINSSVQETLDEFIESGFSKMPVYEENIDNIKGFVSSYDLFKKPESIKAILRNVLFVPETKKCTDMLKEFSVNKASFAIAVDEFGGTAGIITMEDLIEELLGEIKDEYDTEEEVCRKIAENTFIINGKVEIDYVNENFNMKFPKGEYSTIAGFITYFLGRIPKSGETVKLDKFKITIIKTTSTKIDLVKVLIAN